MLSSNVLVRISQAVILVVILYLGWIAISNYKKIDDLSSQLAAQKEQQSLKASANLLCPTTKAEMAQLMPGSRESDWSYLDNWNVPAWSFRRSGNEPTPKVTMPYGFGNSLGGSFSAYPGLPEEVSSYSWAWYCIASNGPPSATR